jgi:hypothetical protein
MRYFVPKDTNSQCLCETMRGIHKADMPKSARKKLRYRAVMSEPAPYGRTQVNVLTVKTSILDLGLTLI